METPTKQLLVLNIAAAGIVLCPQAFAQTVHFMSMPMVNKCSYPNVTIMNPAPPIWIAPNDAKVVTKNVNDFETPANPVPNHDAPAGNHEINPGHFCMFSACTPASITLTCATVGTDTDKAEVILLKRIKGTGATAGDKPAKQ